MNWDQVEGKWKQVKGKVKEKWGKLSDDDLDIIGGKRDQLVGKLQARYGYARDRAEKEVDEFGRAAWGVDEGSGRADKRPGKAEPGRRG